MTLPELLALGESEGVLAPESHARAESAVRQEVEQESLPWYLQAFITVGAWISSGFLIAFVFAAVRNFSQHRHGLLVLGLGAIAAAVVVRRIARSLFVEQACLAVSVAGHGIFFLALSEFDRDLGSIAAAALALAGVLYALYPQPLHRFLSTLSALVLTNVWLIEHFSQHLTTRLLLIGAYLWLLPAVFLPARGPAWLRPLGYAVSVILLGLLLYDAVLGTFGQHAEGPAEGWILSGMAVLAIGWIMGGPEALRAHPRLWLISGLGLLALTVANGFSTLAAFLFLALGYRLQERALLVFGILLGPAMTALHYYNQESTLGEKSRWLMASGAILLVLRVVLARLEPKEAKL